MLQVIRSFEAPQQYPVKSGETFYKGILVGLDSNGQAVPYTNQSMPVGVSGDDAKSLSAGQFTNRVSDFGNETYASGYITVFGKGLYYIDINADAGDSSFATGEAILGATVAVGDRLVPTGTAGKMVVSTATDLTLGFNNTKTKILVGLVVNNLSGSDPFQSVPSGFENFGSKLPTGIPNEFESSSGTPRKFAVVKILI